MSIKGDLWFFPTVLQVLEETKNDILQGMSCALVFFPPLNIADFAEALAGELEREAISLSSISLVDHAPLSIDRLAQSFGIADSNKQNIYSLLHKPEVPQVTFFRSFDELSSPEQNKFVELLNNWIKIQHEGVKKAFCFLVSGKSVPVVRNLQSDVKLNTRILAGIPSSTEIQIYLRLKQSRNTVLDTKWYELLLASIAGNELSLLDYLSNKKLENFEDVVYALEGFLQQVGWNKNVILEQLRDWKPNLPGTSLQLQKIKNSSHICERITIFHPEYGEEIHPAILLFLDRKEEIQHRLWRFQAALTLPLIDQIRQKLYNLLKNRLSVNWNGDIPEIGEIKYALSQLPANHPERTQYFESVERTRIIRNKLAHLEIISKSEYEAVLMFWQKISTRDEPGRNL